MLYRERFPLPQSRIGPAQGHLCPKTFDFSSENSPDYLRYQFILHLCSRTELYPFHNAIPILKVIESNVNVTTSMFVIFGFTSKNGMRKVGYSALKDVSTDPIMENSARVFAEYFQAWSYHLTGPLDKRDEHKCSSFLGPEPPAC